VRLAAGFGLDFGLNVGTGTLVWVRHWGFAGNAKQQDGKNS